MRGGGGSGWWEMCAQTGRDAAHTAPQTGRAAEMVHRSPCSALSPWKGLPHPHTSRGFLLTVEFCPLLGCFSYKQTFRRLPGCASTIYHISRIYWSRMHDYHLWFLWKEKGQSALLRPGLSPDPPLPIFPYSTHSSSSPHFLQSPLFSREISLLMTPLSN